MSDYLGIIRRNLFSPVVVAIFLLASALLYVREYRDAWFISVVIVVNSLIGIFQEIRAKRVLRQLELMNAPKARKIQGEKVVEVNYEDVAVDDSLLISSGDEIPADGLVLESKGLEVNESMLTGESEPIEKKPKDKIYAATTALAGEAVIKVSATDEDTVAGEIGATLKTYTPTHTPLQRSIQWAITGLTYGALIIALVIFIVYFLADQDRITILKTITAGAVSVVPEGLLLASSLLLAFGSLRLAQAKVLPQKLSAIEAMALLGVLCVDKTGTLTSDNLKLEEIVSFEDDQNISALASLVASQTGSGNATSEAILAAHKPSGGAEIVEVMAFSSSRKMAGLRAKVDGEERSLMMGAPEFVSKISPLSADQQKTIDDLSAKGLRVLLLSEAANSKVSLKELGANSGKPIGLVVLRNSLRHGVKDTVKFLQAQEVDIKVISGDNPSTVSYIAKEAGIREAEKSITGAELEKLSDEEFVKFAEEKTVFARVSPDQKEKLIDYFKSRGEFTGMVGDGVNDALALKKADLGIAMKAGAPASRRVADLVLLENSFTSLPMGMRLGNQVMQSIEVVATLFFHKIIYGIVLLAFTMIIGTVYPFAPRHVTFMNIFMVTLPTVLLTLFPSTPGHRINPRNFWRDTLIAVLPIATITGLAVSSSYWVLIDLFPGMIYQSQTLAALVAVIFGVYMVFLVGPMLGVKFDNSAKKARALYVLAVAVVGTVSLGSERLREFFDFTKPEIWMAWPVAGIIILSVIIQWIYAKMAGAKFSSNDN